MGKSINYDFEKGSTILFVLMMVSNVCNYLFQICMGRMLDVNTYGDLNSLMSVLTMATLPSLVFNLVISKFVSEYNQEKNGRIFCFIKIVFRYICIVNICLLTVGILMAEVIANYININDKELIVWTFVIASVTTFTALIIGSLQGLKRFFEYGIVNLIMPVIKLIGSIFFVYLGWKIKGVLRAMFVGYSAMFCIGIYILRKYFVQDTF